MPALLALGHLRFRAPTDCDSPTDPSVIMAVRSSVDPDAMRRTFHNRLIELRNTKESCMKQRPPHTLQLPSSWPRAQHDAVPGVSSPRESMSDKADLVDTAIAAGEFNTLVELVQAAGLEETLRGKALRRLCPTDEAFAAVPAETLDALAPRCPGERAALPRRAGPSDPRPDQRWQGSHHGPGVKSVLFSFVDGVKKVNDATIIGRDVRPPTASFT